MGATPTDMGMPVRRRQRAERFFAKSSKLMLSMPRISRNASSMEYTSICGALSRNTARTRREKSAYRVMLPENTATSCLCTRCRILKNGSPIFIPRAFASLLRAMAQPSLFESTMTGRPSRSGRKTRSHETKKLLQSARANIGN